MLNKWINIEYINPDGDVKEMFVEVVKFELRLEECEKSWKN